MGLKKFLKGAKKVVSSPIKSQVDKFAHPGASFGRIKESFKGGNFLDPVSAISQELDPGVALTHQSYRAASGQELDPASNVNRMSNRLSNKGADLIGVKRPDEQTGILRWIGNKPATTTAALITGGALAGGAGGGAGGAGAAAESPIAASSIPSAGLSSGGAVTAWAPSGAAAGGAGGAAGAGGAGLGGVGNFLGNYGQYIGPVLGAAGQYFGGREAAQGAQAGIDEQRRQYDTNREDLAPYRQVGTGALNNLAGLYGIGPDGQPTNQPVDYSAFNASPDYQYALQEGLKGVEGSAAARGGLYSGNALKALQERGMGIASQNFGNYTNRLAALAGIGQTATNTGVQAGQNSAGNISQLLAQQGDIRGSGIAGAANIFGNAASQIGGMNYQQRRPYYYGAG